MGRSFDKRRGARRKPARGGLEAYGSDRMAPDHNPVSVCFSLPCLEYCSVRCSPPCFSLREGSGRSPATPLPAPLASGQDTLVGLVAGRREVSLAFVSIVAGALLVALVFLVPLSAFQVSGL